MIAKGVGAPAVAVAEGALLGRDLLSPDGALTPAAAPDAPPTITTTTPGRA